MGLLDAMGSQRGVRGDAGGRGDCRGVAAVVVGRPVAAELERSRGMIREVWGLWWKGGTYAVTGNVDRFEHLGW